MFYSHRHVLALLSVVVAVAVFAAPLGGAVVDVARVVMFPVLDVTLVVPALGVGVAVAVLIVAPALGNVVDVVLYKLYFSRCRCCCCCSCVAAPAFGAAGC